MITMTKKTLLPRAEEEVLSPEADAKDSGGVVAVTAALPEHEPSFQANLDESDRLKPRGSSLEGQSVNTFRQVGECWRIAFHGNESLLKDRKGLHYIACLLERPRHPFHVLALVRAIEKQPPCIDTGPYSKLSAKQLEEIGLSESGLGYAENILDRKAFADIKQRRRELQEALRDAEADHNPKLVELARAELEALDEHLTKAVGRGGRSRKSSSISDRARVNVTKQISAAIDAIAAYDPTLGRHLRAAIKTGTTCIYDPECSPDWEIATTILAPASLSEDRRKEKRPLHPRTKHAPSTAFGPPERLFPRQEHRGLKFHASSYEANHQASNPRT